MWKKYSLSLQSKAQLRKYCLSKSEKRVYVFIYVCYGKNEFQQIFIANRVSRSVEFAILWQRYRCWRERDVTCVRFIIGVFGLLNL